MSHALPIISTYNGTGTDASGAARPPEAPDRAHSPDHLVDSHGRIIRDLRLSVTDRCNFRCVYCMDPDFRYMPKQQLLTLEEYLLVARICLSLGITKIRITGGEPTLYPQINELIRELGRMNVPDMAITTNGSLLDRMPLEQWKRDGLRRITLSLDSLRPERVQSITRTNSTPQTVIQAIKLAQAAGFEPIKVNAVIMRGVNDDEVADFADFALEHDIDMRLIEFMPLDSSHAWDRNQVVSADEMLQTIGSRHALVPIEEDDPASTSINFRFEISNLKSQNLQPPISNPQSAIPTPESKNQNPKSPSIHARIGIIAPVTRPFCGACSRLRITADGKVRPCLFSLSEWDLKPLLRHGAAEADLRRFLVDSMWTKQAGHGIGSKTFTQPARTMSAIGG